MFQSKFIMSSNNLISVFIQYYDYLNISECFQLFIGISFVVMVWKGIRFLIQVIISDTGIHYVESQRCPLYMEPLDSPFTFSINIDSASYSGIRCTVKSKQPCFVQALWGVPFDRLVHLMSCETNLLRRAITTFEAIEMFGMNCIDYHVPQLIPANEEANLEYKPRDHTESSLMQPNLVENRVLVPFVLLMVLENDDTVRDTTVVAMANVIHVPNSCIRRPSFMKYQIIKLASGIIGNVEQIYHSSSLNNDNSCLICYMRPASIVFIPCRHCCLCNVCYESLTDYQAGYHDRCPVCRQTPARLFQLPHVISDDSFSENVHFD